MTEKDQRIAIAEACGWYRDTNWKLNGLWNHPKSIISAQWEELPDYLFDLNEAWLAVATLPDEKYDGVEGFTFNLALTVHGDKSIVNGWPFRPMQEATARQRCEAFLKTIGAWKDEIQTAV